jgi:uncharacterized membrane protein
MVPMFKKVWAAIRPMCKTLIVLALSLTLVFSNAHDAWAARSGGRIGGGSFRAPSRTYRAPVGGGSTYRGGGYGGGFGFSPFMPFYGFGFGGGSLFSLLIMLAIGAYLFQAFRNTFGDGNLAASENPTIAIAQVRVGLMAQARSLQLDMDRIAFNADTDSASGRAKVLQEVSLALLRHPEYWAYGSAATELPKLSGAETVFNRLAMSERSKFAEETLTNTNGQVSSPQLTGATATAALVPQTPAELVAMNGDAEYVVVTLLVATQSQLKFPKINSEADMKQTLNQIGSLPADDVMAIEVVWTPQAEGDSLSSDDIMAHYPDLKLV